MGGKSKQTQRTKNNVKPSNSGRSAELLAGGSVPAFVGFAAHSDLGIIPFAPGFSLTENLPDTFDSSVSSQFQLILRKMSKKDPVTKTKALQEFISLISESDADVIKAILPLWPKYYRNLASDIDHRVRENAQQAQSAIITKAGKMIAPFLKQLTPTWIASQFDNYPPAASVAVASFKSSFTLPKMQDVCVFCQNEIMDFVVQNLTFHTASTLSSANSCSPDDAEHKYQRVVVCSFKTFGFYLEKTDSKSKVEIEDKCHTLFSNPKFWSFSKHRVPNIKAAWFELVYNILQYSPNLLYSSEAQLIQVCFQNIDETNLLVLPHVWGCILLIQNEFADWSSHVNFVKNVQPKLMTLLKTGIGGNATSLCPNFLPFISKLSQDIFKNSITLNGFYIQFLNAMKAVMTSTQGNLSKSDYSSLTSAFYECIRYVLQNVKQHQDEYSNAGMIGDEILQNLVLDVIAQSLVNFDIICKYIYVQSAALIAYWSQHTDSALYAHLIKEFWPGLFKTINESLTGASDQVIDRVIELINNLYTAHPSLHDNKVKFSTEDNNQRNKANEKCKSSASFVETDLKKLSVELAQLCVEEVQMNKKMAHLNHLRKLCQLFGDAEFYASISKDCELSKTLDLFVSLLGEDYEPSEAVVSIVFEILSFSEKNHRMEVLNKLLLAENSTTQKWILQRLLSYPLCVEPEIREALSQKHVVEIILKIAEDAVSSNNREKFNLLHKCFFQTDSGDILVSKDAVAGIVKIVSKPLMLDTQPEMIDTCGSFIAQIMPVICSKNATKEVQNETFLTLFQFSVNMTESDNLSEDTLWEITTCWQDALSSEDITLTDELLEKCANVLHSRISDDTLTIDEVANISDMISKLLMCSTEAHEDISARLEAIDAALRILFDDSDNACTITFTSILEAMFGTISVFDLSAEAAIDVPLKSFFRRNLMVASTVSKMICNVQNVVKEKEDDEEYTEDYFDPTESLLSNWSNRIYEIILDSIRFAAIGDSFIENSIVSEDIELLAMNLSEKVKYLLKTVENHFADEIHHKMMESCRTGDISSCRAIPYLLNTYKYQPYLENAAIVLLEEVSEYMLERKSTRAYVNTLQALLPKLSPRAVSDNSEFLFTESDVGIKSAFLRCLILNRFSGDYNEISDRKVIIQVNAFITDVSEKRKDLLFYNCDVSKQEATTVFQIVEYINLFTAALSKFPTDLSIKTWDSIRFGLGSWVLSVSKSIECLCNPKVLIFTAAVYRLYGEFARFIQTEKNKSSTEFLSNILDEWNNLFAREVNLVFFKSYYNLVSAKEFSNFSISYVALVDNVSPVVESFDYSIIFSSYKTSGSKISLVDLTKFVLENLSNKIHSIRASSMFILKKLAHFYVVADMETLVKRDDSNSGVCEEEDWHFLSQFKSEIENAQTVICKYLDEFSFKLTELAEFKQIDRDEALSYLFLWDCIVFVCSNAPVELRSFYATWITDNKYEEKYLNFLFRAMPVEILKNHDSKLMNNDLFKGLSWVQIKDSNLQIERYACHLYTEVLRRLPAIVRKWWNTSHSRQKTFVDKLTTNFVSSLICNEELKAITTKKHENIQVTVHTSTREVFAIYSVDEARMELVISLAQNYPLGGVKVESGKQIGSRASSRNFGIQLTIFLTHQNGSIFDGLSLWKKNMDKKFEGVEECYICYAVIHQDTCQLPKLTCKTCRKKFHGKCLYKWFTTSHKSTCPICRNVF